MARNLFDAFASGANFAQGQELRDAQNARLEAQALRTQQLHDLEQEDRARADAAAEVTALGMFNPDGTVNEAVFDDPQVMKRVNANPYFQKILSGGTGKAVTFAGFAPTPNGVTPILQHRGPGGIVESEGPQTVNRSADPNDKIVSYPSRTAFAKQLYASLAPNKEFSAQLAAGRRLGAYNTALDEVYNPMLPSDAPPAVPVPTPTTQVQTQTAASQARSTQYIEPSAKPTTLAQSAQVSVPSTQDPHYNQVDYQVAPDETLGGNKSGGLGRMIEDGLGAIGVTTPDYRARAPERELAEAEAELAAARRALDDHDNAPPAKLAALARARGEAGNRDALAAAVAAAEERVAHVKPETPAEPEQLLEASDPPGASLRATVDAHAMDAKQVAGTADDRVPAGLEDVTAAGPSGSAQSTAVHAASTPKASAAVSASGLPVHPRYPSKLSTEQQHNEGLVRAAADKYGVDPQLLVNMAMQESNLGSNKATSRAGAQGMMQFMPATWKHYGGGADINDPAASADAAARMMRDLLKQYDGDERKALAAYNGGSGNLAKVGGIDKMPRETREYVETIAGGGAPVPVTAKVEKAVTQTPPPRTAVEVSQAEHAVESIKPAKKLNRRQLNALVRMHKIAPDRVPLETLNKAFSTGRLTGSDVKFFSTKGGLVRTEDGQATIVPGTSTAPAAGGGNSVKAATAVNKLNRDQYNMFSDIVKRTVGEHDQTGFHQAVASTPGVEMFQMDLTNPATVQALHRAYRARESAKDEWFADPVGDSLTPYLVMETNPFADNQQVDNAYTLLGNAGYNAATADKTLAIASRLQQQAAQQGQRQQLGAVVQMLIEEQGRS